MLQAVIDILQAKTRTDEDSNLLRQTLSHLVHLRDNPGSREVTWYAIHNDFSDLIEQGLWEPSPENEALLDEIRAFITKFEDTHEADSESVSSPVSPLRKTAATAGEKQRISIVAPPAVSEPINYPHMSFTKFLPEELLDVLDHSFLLHLLATDPAQVLPPGKSLVSALSHPHVRNARSEGELPTLKDRVENIVHKAFWDEVRTDSTRFIVTTEHIFRHLTLCRILSHTYNCLA